MENLASGDGKQDQTVELELEGKHPAIEREYKRHGFVTEHVHLTGDWDKLAARLASVRDE